MKSMEENVEKLESQLKEWGVKLDALEAKAKKAGAEAKTDFHKSIEVLKTKIEAAKKKIAEYKAEGGGKWDVFKGNLEALWKDIEVTFKGLTQ